MKLTHFIIHEIEKESATKKGNSEPKIVLESNTEFPVDSEVSISFVEKLRQKYNVSISGYGCVENGENSKFSDNLKEYRAGNLDFVKLTTLLLDRLNKELKSSPAATGGLVVVVEYEEADKSYLLISMIKEKSAITFDKSAISLSEILSIDLDKLHEGARIDLKKWEALEQPHISFTKRSRDKITDYFANSIDCLDYTDSKTYTIAINTLLQSYAKANEWPDEKYKEAKKSMQQYFADAITKKKDSTEQPTVSLKVLSTIIDPTAENDFYDFIRAQTDIEISDEFQPHADTVRGWKRATVKSGTIKLSFDMADLEKGSVSSKNGFVFISDPNGQLQEQLDELKRR